MKSTVHGSLRWYVHRIETRPARLGERHGPLKWVVTPIILGRGSHGLRAGTHTRCADRDDALRFAHRQAQRTYGPRKDRK